MTRWDVFYKQAQDVRDLVISLYATLDAITRCHPNDFTYMAES